MYIKVKRLINPYEERMLEFLETCINNNYRISTQVSLSQICEIVSPIDVELRRFLYTSTTVDALITDLDFMPILVVEFQSSYHNSDSAKERDRKKAQLLKMAGVPLIYSQIKNFGLLNLYSDTENIVCNLFTGKCHQDAQNLIKKYLQPFA